MAFKRLQEVFLHLEDVLSLLRGQLDGSDHEADPLNVLVLEQLLLRVLGLLLLVQLEQRVDEQGHLKRVQLKRCKNDEAIESVTSSP